MAASDHPPPLEQVVRPTVAIESARLSRRLGAEVTLVSETFQHTGSFKFRAAYNLAANVPEPMIIAASSGNFGQALAYACRMTGKRCIIVMPAGSARVKVEAVLDFGGRPDFIDTARISRAERVAQLAREHPDARVASAYDDPLVIAGNASLGREIAALKRRFDIVVVPVGGGGLSAGIITGMREAGCAATVIGAEPMMANDAARSMRSGRIIANEREPATIADGARTISLGRHNWPILRDGMARIVEVGEAQIAEAVRMLFALANLKAEPTGALGIGAMLAEPSAFAGRRACCVISGGNVDAQVYREILAGG